MAPRRVRADVLLVERGLAGTQAEAEAYLRAGQVSVSGRRIDKPGELLESDAVIDFKPLGGRFVSRGGEKLAGALEDLGVLPAGRVCLDVGASTGGFTDCLLQAGAIKVFAIDVGRNQLHERLRNDARVVSRERTHLRDVAPGELVPAPSLIVVDVSFTSLAGLFPAIAALAGDGAEALLMVKPQFELEARDVPSGGVVADPDLHRAAVERVLTSVRGCGWIVAGVAPSRLPGTEGNREFFVHTRRPPEQPAGPSFAS